MSKVKNDGVTYEVRAGQALKTVVGWIGDDWLQGGTGNDVLIDLLGDNLFDAGAGSDTVIGGLGDDLFIHRIGQNAGARDAYEGGLGTDTLRLELTAAEWARADVQADIQRFLAHVGTLKNKITGLVGLTSDFTFKSTNLTVSKVEKLEVRVDGVTMNLADESVFARNDRLELHEDAGPTTIDLLLNDSAPDRVASIQLLTASQLGTATLTPSLLTTPQTAVLTFVPSAAAQALRAGETGTETLTYRITDVDGDTSTATVTVVVEGRNDAAVIGDPSAATVQEDVGVTGGQLKTSGRISISDVDTSEASFRTAVVAQPGALGTLTLAANGAYTFSVDNAAVQHLGAGESHVSSFRVTALDGTEKVVSFTIWGSNDGPAAQADNAGPLVERGVAAGTATAAGNVLSNDTDVDTRDTKTVSAVNGDAAKVGATVAGLYGHLVLAADGAWAYSLDDGNLSTDRLAQGQTVQDSFTYTMRDRQGAASTATLTITVQGSNDAPTVSGAVSEAATEGTAPVEIDLLQGAADVDAGAVLRVENLVGIGPDGSGWPAGLSWSGTTLRVDPRHAAFAALAAGEEHVLTVAYDVVDENGARVAQVATITVTGTNDAATISGMAFGTLAEDEAPAATSGQLLVADLDAGEALFTPQTLTEGLYGTFDLAENGTWTYAANNDLDAIQQLGAGQALTDNFMAISKDGSASQVVTVRIVGTNDAATILGATTASVMEDVQTTVGDTVSVADRDTDEARFRPVAAADLVGNYGIFAFDASTGAWTYALDPARANALSAGQVEHDTLIVSSLDGTGIRALDVTVTGTNDAPVITMADRDGALIEPIAPNGTLVDSGTLTFSDVDLRDTHSVSAEAVGQVLGSVAATIAADTTGSGTGGKIAWTYSVAASAVEYLAAGETKVERFLVTLDDGQGGTVSETVTVTIEGTNDAPVISAANGSVAENETGVLIATFTVADVDTTSGLTFRVLDEGTVDPRFVVGPAAGTTSGQTGTYEIRLATGQSFDFEAMASNPTFTRTVEVHDGQALNSFATSSFTITVTDVPEAPVAVDDQTLTFEDRTITFTVAELTGNDANVVGGQPLTISGVSGALNGSVSFANGVVTFTPAANFSGVARFDYTLDNGAGTDAGTVAIDVAPVADRPILAGGVDDPAAITPLGGDEPVGQPSTDEQYTPSVAALPTGYAVAWAQAGADPDSHRVHVQIFASDGTEIGLEAIIGPVGANNPTISAGEDGFVVSWAVRDPQTYRFDLFAQAFSATGTPIGGETRLNAQPLLRGPVQATAAVENGYVVAWEVPTDTGSTIAWRVITADGSPATPEMRLPSPAAERNLVPAVAAIDGGFVLTWHSPIGNTDYDVQTQRFALDGTALGPITTVAGASPQLYPTVVGIAGGYVVSWISFEDGDYGVQAQVFATDGTPRGGEISVETTATGNQIYPSVAAFDGGFVISWTAFEPNSTYGMYAQRFTSEGDRIGGEFRLNADLPGDQVFYGDQGGNGIAMTGDGVLVALWLKGYGVEGIEHRRFALSAALAGKEDEVIDIPVAATLADLDGSEQIASLTLTGVPAGAILSDGTRTAVSDGEPISLLGWDLAQLTFHGAPDFNGTVSLTLTGEVVDTAELSGGVPATDRAAWTRTFDLVIRSVNDAALIGGVAAGEVAEDSADASGNLVVTGALTVSDVDAGEAFFVPRAAVAGLYGTFSLSAEGDWAYTARSDQAAIQALGAGETALDSFTATSKDGSTSQVVTVTIQGANDRPVAVADIGSVGENERKLFDVVANDTDPDRNDVRVLTSIGAITVRGLPPTTAQAASFSIWDDQILFDPGTAFDFLPEGQVAEVVVGYGMSDGAAAVSASQLTLRVVGRDDQPIFGGQSTGSVTEDLQISTRGQLTIQDPDSGQARPVSPSASGSYGSLTIDSLGEWSYRLNNGLPAVQALNTGQTLTDTVTVRSADGTATDIRIEINGTTDPVPIDFDGQPITYSWEYRASGPPSVRSYVQTETVGSQVEFTHRDIWSQSWTVDLNDTVITIDYLTAAYWSSGAFNGIYLTDTQNRLPDFSAVEMISNNTGAVVSVASKDEIAVNWQNTSMTPSSLISFRVKTTDLPSQAQAFDFSSFGLEADDPLAALSEGAVSLPLSSPADLGSNDYLLA